MYNIYIYIKNPKHTHNNYQEYQACRGDYYYYYYYYYCSSSLLHQGLHTL